MKLMSWISHNKYSRDKEECLLDCGDLEVLLSILRLYLPIAITVNMVKYFLKPSKCVNSSLPVNVTV